MKNPCDICIIKVNCTSICSEKENYVTLIQAAVYQNSFHPKTGRPAAPNYMEYIKTKNKNIDETMEITLRNYEKRGGDNDPVSRKVRKILRDAQRAVRPKYNKSDI
jgi:hypothetical protein